MTPKTLIIRRGSSVSNDAQDFDLECGALSSRSISLLTMSSNIPNHQQRKKVKDLKKLLWIVSPFFFFFFYEEGKGGEHFRKFRKKKKKNKFRCKVKREERSLHKLKNSVW